MKIIDGIRNAFGSGYTAHATPGKEGDGVDHYRSYTGQDVSLQEIIERLKTSPMFNMVVRVSADATCGAGFSLSANGDSMKSRTALELVEDFCDDVNMDALLQECAVDAWACGNFWTEWTKTGLIRKIPTSEIIQINIDKDSEPISYRRQRYGGNTIDVPVNKLTHFRFQRLDISAYGTGLGHLLSRQGYGYRNPSGKIVRRASLFDIEEMVTDIASKQLYAGLPRWIVNVGKNGKQAIDDVVARMKKQEPLDHIVTNSDVKADHIALSPSNKMDSLLKNLYNSSVMGHMSPLPTLWQDMSNFAYNSAESALKSALPLISAMQQALKRYVELEIFKPLLERHGYDWKKHRVSIAFGPEDSIGIDDISEIVGVLSGDQFKGRYNPENILDMLRDVGVPLDYITPEAAEKSIHNADRMRKQRHAYRPHALRRETGQSADDKLKRKLLRRY